MRFRLIILVALLTAGTSACATEDTPRVAPSAASSTQEAEPRAPDSVAPSAPQEPAPSAPTPAPANPGAQLQVPDPTPGHGTVIPDNAPGATAEERNRHRLERAGALIQEAIEAGSAVPINGEDHCAVSYRALEAMLASLARAMPDQPQNPIPPRDAYVELCRELPVEVQQCMVIQYAVQHQEDCQRVTEGLDPALRARIEAMMASGAQPDAAP